MIDGKDDAGQARVARVVTTIRAWGLGELAAALVASGPLAFLSAQALYFSAPVIDTFGTGEEALGWARLLEDPAATADLARQLADTT